jgi:hypothetical protein
LQLSRVHGWPRTPRLALRAMRGFIGTRKDMALNRGAQLAAPA